MIKPIRSVFVLLSIALISLSLAVAIPAIAQSPDNGEVVEPTRRNIDLMNRGQAAYEAGRYREAVTFWQQLARKYEKMGDRLMSASSLNYLSLAHQELGQWQQAQQEITRSLELLQQPKSTKQDLALLGQALNTQGSLYLATGNPESALETWQQAASNYEAAEDKMGMVGSQVNQAQALQTLGLHRRSQKLLAEVQEKLNEQSDPLVKAKVLHSLGNTLQTIGDLNQSQVVLEESLAIAQKYNLSGSQAGIVFSLGNVARLKEDNENAISLYQQAVESDVYPLTKVESQLNLLNSLITMEQWQAVESLLPEIKANMTDLPNSRPTIYAQVNLAKNMINLEGRDRSTEIESLLKQSIKQAQALKDPRAESSAWGTLGSYYERQQQWSKAQIITSKALKLAEAIDAEDLGYQWQWQLGRLLQAQNQTEKAIAPYTAAVDNLQSLRSSLVAINTDAQFSFRQSVEPVYRELVGLLLEDDPSQEQLQQARDVIESLQLAELENFFQEACIDIEPKQIDQVDSTAAVIYPIILRDRIAVILSLPDRTLKHYSTYLPQAEIDNTIENLYQSFYPFFSDKQRKKLSQQVYDWLIKPAEADLAKNQVKTLAFVLDNGLRNIPMSALYDGQQYAVEKYNIALTPGLQLLPSQGLKTEQIKAVIAGVSESTQGFAALPGVKEEVIQISAQLNSQTLLNESFTDTNLQVQLEKTNAPIVHLATHGQFGATPEETFINTWDGRIKVNELENLLRNRESSKATPIELMVLSACQTAAGDNRAALGMAGMAVRSGARSTLATLWSVKDESTSRLIDEFYQQLLADKSSFNKAAALRQAQLNLIHSQDFNHPFYWSPFVLVGNWS